MIRASLEPRTAPVPSTASHRGPLHSELRRLTARLHILIIVKSTASCAQRPESGSLHPIARTARAARAGRALYCIRGARKLASVANETGPGRRRAPMPDEQEEEVVASGLALRVVRLGCGPHARPAGRDHLL